MKKIVFVILGFSLCFILNFCASSKPNISAHADNLHFPLEEVSRINYEGEITHLAQKDDGCVYFTTAAGFIYCADGAKQDIIWKYAAGQPVLAPPVIGPEHIFFYDSQNHVYSLDKKGVLLWEKNIQGNISGEITEFQGRIFFGTQEGEFIALEASSGNDVWHFRTKGSINTEAVFWENSIIFGSSDNQLNFLNQEGKLAATFSVRAEIQKTILLEGKYLYFSSSDDTFQCFNLAAKKEKWKIATGGRLVSAPVTDKGRIFFLNSNNVLFGLNKRSGEILWWKAIPSRSSYNLEICGKQIVVSSFSPLLASFNTETGEKTGEYNAGEELKSNPLWLSPHLLIHLFNSAEGQGILVFLKRKAESP